MDDIKETETSYRQTDGEQNTGNHTTGETYGGADRFGGTRAGAENVERPAKTNIETGTDVEKVAGLDERLDEDVSVNGPAERAPERDERGRL